MTEGAVLRNNWKHFVTQKHSSECKRSATTKVIWFENNYNIQNVCVVRRLAFHEFKKQDMVSRRPNAKPENLIDYFSCLWQNFTKIRLQRFEWYCWHTDKPTTRQTHWSKNISSLAEVRKLSNVKFERK